MDSRRCVPWRRAMLPDGEDSVGGFGSRYFPARHHCEVRARKGAGTPSEQVDPSPPHCVRKVDTVRHPDSSEVTWRPCAPRPTTLAGTPDFQSTAAAGGSLPWGGADEWLRASWAANSRRLPPDGESVTWHLSIMDDTIPPWIRNVGICAALRRGRGCLSRLMTLSSWMTAPL